MADSDVEAQSGDEGENRTIQKCTTHGVDAVEVEQQEHVDQVQCRHSIQKPTPDTVQEYEEQADHDAEVKHRSEKLDLSTKYLIMEPRHVAEKGYQTDDVKGKCGPKKPPHSTRMWSLESRQNVDERNNADHAVNMVSSPEKNRHVTKKKVFELDLNAAHQGDEANDVVEVAHTQEDRLVTLKRTTHEVCVGEDCDLADYDIDVCGLGDSDTEDWALAGYNAGVRQNHSPLDLNAAHQGDEANDVVEVANTQEDRLVTLKQTTHVVCEGQDCDLADYDIDVFGLSDSDTEDWALVGFNTGVPQGSTFEGESQNNLEAAVQRLDRKCGQIKKDQNGEPASVAEKKRQADDDAGKTCLPVNCYTFKSVNEETAAEEEHQVNKDATGFAAAGGRTVNKTDQVKYTPVKLCHVPRKLKFETWQAVEKGHDVDDAEHEAEHDAEDDAEESRRLEECFYLNNKPSMEIARADQSEMQAKYGTELNQGSENQGHLIAKPGIEEAGAIEQEDQALPFRVSRRLQNSQYYMIQQNKDESQPEKKAAARDETSLRKVHSLLRKKRSPCSRIPREVYANQHQENNATMEAQQQVGGASGSKKADDHGLRSRRVRFADPLVEGDEEELTSGKVRREWAKYVASNFLKARKKSLVFQAMHPTKRAKAEVLQHMVRSRKSKFSWENMCNYVGPKNWKCYRESMKGKYFCVYHQDNKLTPFGSKLSQATCT